MAEPAAVDEIGQALLELGDLVRCVCHPAYEDRGLRDPGCHCDSAPALLILREALGRGGDDEQS